jgi:hypothetical protein
METRQKCPDTLLAPRLSIIDHLHEDLYSCSSCCSPFSDLRRA